MLTPKTTIYKVVYGKNLHRCVTVPLYSMHRAKKVAFGMEIALAKTYNLGLFLQNRLLG